MGTHEWYPEGAKALLASQKVDGSWGVGTVGENKVDRGTVDTCFAILFLKRATRPLDVVSVDRFHQKMKE